MRATCRIPAQAEQSRSLQRHSSVLAQTRMFYVWAAHECLDALRPFCSSADAKARPHGSVQASPRAFGDQSAPAASMHQLTCLRGDQLYVHSKRIGFLVRLRAVPPPRLYVLGESAAVHQLFKSTTS